MLKFFVFAALAFTGFSAMARGGDYKGNGGNLIYCPHKASPYEVADLYEARAAHDLKIQFAPGNTYSEILENMFVRIARLNPTRADLYRGYLRTFEAERRLIPDAKLEVLPEDQGWMAIEEGCSLVQAVVQFRNPNLYGLRYFVDATLWNKLDEQNKAALTLHEFIYREGLLEENSFGNSLGVRYLNGILHSDMMSRLTLKQYIQTLQKVGLQAADAQGVGIRLHTGRGPGNASSTFIAFWNDNIVARATLPDVRFTIPTGSGHKENVRCLVQPGQEREHEIGFYRDGTPQFVEMKCMAPVQIDLRGPTSSGRVMADHLEFAETGLLSHVRAEPRQWDQLDALTYASDNFSITRHLGPTTGSLEVYFGPEGIPAAVCMGQDAKGRAESWRQIQNKRESFATSLKSAIAFGYDNSAYEYDYPCSQTGSQK